MPIRNDHLYCANHPEQVLQQAPYPHALVEADTDSGTPVFKTDRGALVTLYCCPQCGYIELYLNSIAAGDSAL